MLTTCSDIDKLVKDINSQLKKAIENLEPYDRQGVIKELS